MKIKNYEVPYHVIRACEARMKRGPFRSSDIEDVAVEGGVPRFIDHAYIANRVADRLIQKHRKAGKIVLRKREWRFVAEDAAKKSKA